MKESIMKTLNKKLLSTAILFIGLCCLSSFNPFSANYNNEESLSSASTTAAEKAVSDAASAVVAAATPQAATTASANKPTAVGTTPPAQTEAEASCTGDCKLKQLEEELQVTRSQLEQVLAQQSANTSQDKKQETKKEEKSKDQAIVACEDKSSFKQQYDCLTDLLKKTNKRKHEDLYNQTSDAIASIINDAIEECANHEDFRKGYNCYSDLLKRISKTKNNDAYTTIMANISSLASDIALSERPNMSHLERLKTVAKGDRETLTNINAAVDYVNTQKYVSAYQGVLERSNQQLDFIQQQRAMLGNCNSVNTQVNFNCNMLAMQEKQITISAQNDIKGLRNRMSIYLGKYQTASNFSDYQTALNESFLDFLSPYQNLIASNSSLVNFDTIPVISPEDQQASLLSAQTSTQLQNLGVSPFSPGAQNLYNNNTQNQFYNPNLRQPGAQFVTTNFPNYPNNNQFGGVNQNFNQAGNVGNNGSKPFWNRP